MSALRHNSLNLSNARCLVVLGVLSTTLACVATQLQILKSFGYPNSIGQNPYSALIEGSDGIFYGTTYNGGSSSYGTLFKLDATGSNYAVLHHFGGTTQDGKNPQAELLEGSDGALYGTTSSHNGKTTSIVFQITKAGTNYNILHYLALCSE